MKTFLISCLLAILVTCAGLTLAAQTPHQHSDAAKNETSAATVASGEVIKRGAPLGDSPRVEFAEVLKEPSKFNGKRVRIEGVVEKVCKMEGCWMEISPKAGASRSIRVTFKNHGFFVPKDADRMRFSAEGEFGVKTLTKEQVDHLVKEDGATIARNADGTANEVTFVATGVELRK